MSADDDDYVSKYIPTVAPATPQVLATPSLDFIDGIHSSVITEVVPLKQNEEDSLIIKTEENKENTNDQEDSGESDKLNLLEIEQNNSSLSQKYCFSFISLSDLFYEQRFLRTRLHWKVSLFIYLFIFFICFYQSLSPKLLECLPV